MNLHSFDGLPFFFFTIDFSQSISRAPTFPTVETSVLGRLKDLSRSIIDKTETSGTSETVLMSRDGNIELFVGVFYTFTYAYRHKILINVRV